MLTMDKILGNWGMDKGVWIRGFGDGGRKRKTYCKLLVNNNNNNNIHHRFYTFMLHYLNKATVTIIIRHQHIVVVVFVMGSDSMSAGYFKSSIRYTQNFCSPQAANRQDFG